MTNYEYIKTLSQDELVVFIMTEREAYLKSAEKEKDNEKNI